MTTKAKTIRPGPGPRKVRITDNRTIIPPRKMTPQERQTWRMAYACAFASVGYGEEAIEVRTLRAARRATSAIDGIRGMVDRCGMVEVPKFSSPEFEAARDAMGFDR
jgi:hypothetical protein